LLSLSFDVSIKHYFAGIRTFTVIVMVYP